MIHPDQYGFLKQRSINENLMDLMSIINYTRVKKLNALLISFDFEKAFDKVNFEYLDRVLEAFDFGLVFQTMIVNAHKDTVSCAVNAGFSSDYIKI